jgi:hypothetical protein
LYASLKTNFEPGTLPNLVANTITRSPGIVKNQPSPHPRFSHSYPWFSSVSAPIYQSTIILNHFPLPLAAKPKAREEYRSLLFFLLQTQVVCAIIHSFHGGRNGECGK